MGGDAMAQIMEALYGGSLLDRVMLGLVIVLVAGVGEELIFRGFVWDACEQSYGPTAAWIISSLLFAAFHLNLVQSLGLIPLSLFIGWLRLRSGSIVPCIVAHIANNSFALATTLYFGLEDETEIPLALAAASLTLCAIIAVAVAKFSPLKGR
jgi:membrane protease YdiL (CAAX protease family)